MLKLALLGNTMKSLMFLLSFFLYSEIFSCDDVKSNNPITKATKVIDLSCYIKSRSNFLNIPTKVKGKFFNPEDCPKCPPGASCKPCYNAYFVLESFDGTTKINVNLNPTSKISSSMKNAQTIELPITFLGENGFGLSTPYGFFAY